MVKSLLTQHCSVCKHLSIFYMLKSTTTVNEAMRAICIFYILANFYLNSIVFLKNNLKIYIPYAFLPMSSKL